MGMEIKFSDNVNENQGETGVENKTTAKSSNETTTKENTHGSQISNTDAGQTGLKIAEPNENELSKTAVQTEASNTELHQNIVMETETSLCMNKANSEHNEISTISDHDNVTNIVSKGKQHTPVKDIEGNGQRNENGIDAVPSVLQKDNDFNNHKSAKENGRLFDIQTNEQHSNNDLDETLHGQSQHKVINVNENASDVKLDNSTIEKTATIRDNVQPIASENHTNWQPDENATVTHTSEQPYKNEDSLQLTKQQENRCDKPNATKNNIDETNKQQIHTREKEKITVEDEHCTCEEQTELVGSKFKSKNNANITYQNSKNCEASLPDQKENELSSIVPTDNRYVDKFKLSASIQTLKRSTTTPDLYGNRDPLTKVLHKRNTVPNNLTDTLLMVGRMHDVEEKTLENIKKLSLEIPESKKTCNTNDEAKQSNINIKNTPYQCCSLQKDSNTCKDNKHCLENMTVEKSDESGNKITTLIAQPHLLEISNKSVLNADRNIQNPDLSTHEQEYVSSRLRSSSRVSILVNDIEKDDNADDEDGNNSNFVPPQTSFESDIITDELSEKLNQPCLINISSCSSVTIGGGFSPDTNVDQNLLFVNDSDTTSLNHYKTAKTPKRNKVAPTRPRESTVTEPKISRQDSGICNVQPTPDENLEEARTRMHSLLDQAFSLISPRASMTETDIRNKRNGDQMAAPHSSNEPRQDRDDTGTSSKWKVAKGLERGKDVQDEPMYVNPAFSESYSDFPLETWSPYRASDQVALISMPHRLEPEPIRLGYKPDKRPASSKPNKRPAASFDFNESKSTSAIDDSKYTTNNPKPIVLRTKDSSNNIKTDSAKSNGTKSNRKYSVTGIGGDVYLTGSTTSLSGSKARNRSDNMEMATYQNGSSKSHRAPRKDLKNSDEVDVVNTLQTPDSTDNLISSLRAELNGLKESFKPETKPGKRRKSNARAMTEIV